MIRPRSANNEIYHIYNRGVEKRKIFSETSDYLRFVHDLYEFNNEEPAINLTYHIGYSHKEVGLPKFERERGKPLVDIMAFCLMPNHFHLMLRQKTTSGITEFMRKLGTGYTNFFNQKYDRVGPLFQGKYKLVLLKSDSHFIHLPFYIHLNPLDLKFLNWRGEKFSDHRKAMQFLETYQWSSFPDYIGKKNFPSVTQREFLMKFFGGPEHYKKEINLYLLEATEENERIRNLLIE